MTQTIETFIPQTELETTTETSWDTASSYVAALADHENFIDYTLQHGLEPETLEYADAFSNFTEYHIESTNLAEVMSEKEVTQISLLGATPYAALANEQLTTTDSYDEKRALKDKLVWYNQTLSEYMHTYPEESFSELHQVIIETAIDNTSHDMDTSVTSTMNGILLGARTEAATRTMFDEYGIPNRPATTEEDLRGADIFVSNPNGSEYPIDIKHSLDQLAKSSNGYDFASEKKMYVIKSFKNGEKRILLFPGFVDSDLGDTLTLDDETLASRKNDILGQIVRAAAEFDK